MTPFVAFLDGLRRERRMTWGELAMLVGVSENTLHNWRCGKNSPTIEHAEKALAVVGARIRYEMLEIRNDE